MIKLLYYAILAGFLTGCASTEGGYTCYRVVGPFYTYSTNQTEAEKQSSGMYGSGSTPWFDHADSHVECTRGNGERLSQ